MDRMSAVWGQLIEGQGSHSSREGLFPEPRETSGWRGGLLAQHWHGPPRTWLDGSAWSPPQTSVFPDTSTAAKIPIPGLCRLLLRKTSAAGGPVPPVSLASAAPAQLPLAGSQSSGKGSASLTAPGPWQPSRRSQPLPWDLQEVLG